MKLKGFSFIEIMVAIIISGIVISTAYSVYLFTYKQVFRFSGIKEEIRDYFELSEVLNNDVENAKKIIEKNNREVQMQLSGKTIDYLFDDDMILRNMENRTDTFLFLVSALQLNSIDLPNSAMLIDNINITTADNNILSFHKDYGAVIYIEE